MSVLRRAIRRSPPPGLGRRTSFVMNRDWGQMSNCSHRQNRAAIASRAASDRWSSARGAILTCPVPVVQLKARIARRRSLPLSGGSWSHSWWSLGSTISPSSCLCQYWHQCCTLRSASWYARWTPAP
eukprot:9498766-Pyramimonas_sp.AAC.1